jgi:hypothetical protein
MKMILPKSVEKKKKDHECKGLFWRCIISSFVSSYDSIEVRKSLRLLKKRSCKGCETCSWVLDYFREDISEIDDYLNGLKNGWVYTYRVYTSQGFEDLYPEIDEIAFIEVEDNHGQKI